MKRWSEEEIRQWLYDTSRYIISDEDAHPIISQLLSDLAECRKKLDDELHRPDREVCERCRVQTARECAEIAEQKGNWWKGTEIHPNHLGQHIADAIRKKFNLEG